MIIGMPHICTIYRRAKKQKLTYSGGAGTPTVGQTLSQTTGVAPNTVTVTAVVDTVATGYIVVKTLSGLFTPGVAITTATFSGTLTTQEDYKNTLDEYQYYWKVDQSNVKCKFYRSKAKFIVSIQGASYSRPLKCALPTTINITPTNSGDFKINTTETLFVGTYTLNELFPAQSFGKAVDHFETELVYVLAGVS